MPKHKKKFISKKNSVTFHLVHRSQHDPLVVDESAPQRVLAPAKSKKEIDEEQKYGIFFDDEYNYLQHLKSVDDWEGDWEETEKRPEKPKDIHKKKVQLPSSVFPSEVKETVGVLNKAAPCGLNLDLDPDVIAALDDDFDFDDPENELEDNFMELANEAGSDASGNDFEENDDEDDLDSLMGLEDVAEEDEEIDEVGDLPDEFRDFETKSRFTDYSLTSSVIRRNEQLSLLDDRFEKAFEGYDQGELGALDCDEIEGTMSMDDRRLLEMAEKYKEDVGSLGEVCDLKVKTLALAESLPDADEVEDVVVEDKGEKWDCESILSTYSNIYNHPAKISEPKGPRKIKVDKMGMPVDELEGRNGTKLTAKNLAALSGDGQSSGPKSIISMISELSYRPKDETKEEKHVRKKNIKEYRRERRVERKANTAAFKAEKAFQEKVQMNLVNNLRGVKLL